MLIFGFYTKNTPYEGEAKILIRSLDALRHQHDFVAVDSRGTWQKNTQMKAEIVADFIARYPGERLAYIDVDAAVLAKPVLFDSLTCDIGCTLYGHGSPELLSGTIFLQSNERTAALVQRWREINREFPETLPDGRQAWDQRTLQMAIGEHVEKGLRFQPLPQEYCYMVGNSQRQYPGLSPVILHYSAALRFGTGETMKW